MKLSCSEDTEKAFRMTDDIYEYSLAKVGDPNM